VTTLLVVAICFLLGIVTEFLLTAYYDGTPDARSMLILATVAMFLIWTGTWLLS
jgi:Na+-driven multidrug efflux pump